MKLLLTSGGIKNKSIKDALIEMLGKPISEANALCIPTAIYARPGGFGRSWGFLSGKYENSMCELGWKSLGVLELTALPSIDREIWIQEVKNADVILVNGGDPLYLAYWMRESGFAELLPTLKAVYVGMSAGSMVMAPRIGEAFVGWQPKAGGDETLGLVDFAMFPHLDHVSLPKNTMETAIKWAKTISTSAYVVDDETAISVVDGAINVISEGKWKLL